MRFISKLGASNSSVVEYHCEWERCGERSDGGASATSMVVQPYFEVSLQLCAGGKEGVGESPTSGATERPTLGWIVLVEFTLSILLPAPLSLSLPISFSLPGNSGIPTDRTRVFDFFPLIANRHCWSVMKQLFKKLAGCSVSDFKLD